MKEEIIITIAGLVLWKVIFRKRKYLGNLADYTGFPLIAFLYDRHRNALVDKESQ